MILWWLMSCGLVGTPDAEVQGFSLTELGYRAAQAQVVVGLHNPLWVDVHVQSLRWEFQVADQAIASGQTDAAKVLEAGATTPMTIPVELRYAAFYRAAGAFVGEGESPESPSAVPYRVSMEMDTITPSGFMTIPVVDEGTLPRLSAPSIDLMDVGWEVEADGRLRLDLSLHLGLPEGFRASHLDWAIEVDRRVLASGAADANEEGSMTFPAWLDRSGVAEASWNYLWGDAKRLDVAFHGEVSTPWGGIPLHAARSIQLQEYGGLSEDL